jgi:hypothetical protein
MFNSKHFSKMKKIVCVMAVCLILASCEKYDSGPISQDLTGRRALSDSETLLKTNLDQAAQILADVIQDETVLNELVALSREDRDFYSLPFSDLIDESKSAAGSFRNLRTAFINGCTSSESKGNTSDLISFLSKNGCYIYCPYPSSFYPKGTNSFTVAAHPIDNDMENTGYRFEGKKMVQVKVNEEYTDKNMVLLLMPKDEDDDDTKGLSADAIPGAKGDPVYEVKVGKVRCADYCGGIFEGELELRLSRGYPEMNISTGAVTGKFSTVIPVKYPRSYAKAAINDWTVHSLGGWYSVFVPWDTNWRPEKIQQCMLVYEYDTVKESTVNASVAYKADALTPSVTTTVKASYSGDFLGLVEWDRDWFMRTNSNPEPGDEVKDGWTVRLTCADFLLTTPLRTIY